MAKSTPPANDASEAGVTGSAPLYIKPEPLSLEEHRRLGLKDTDKPFAFAAHQHFAPILSGEFTMACLHYPIIFAGQDLTPLAIMGVNPGENLFFNADGSAVRGAYMPAYIRRYPFTVADDTSQSRMVVCVDVGSPLIVENPDHPFFDAQGNATAYTEQCIKFCQDFDMERVRSEAFVQTLKDLDLFESRQAEHAPNLGNGKLGPPVVVANFVAVSEDKLMALPQDKIMELRNSGALALIYAHLLSLNGWDRLIELTFARWPDRPINPRG